MNVLRLLLDSWPASTWLTWWTCECIGKCILVLAQEKSKILMSVDKVRDAIAVLRSGAPYVDFETKLEDLVKKLKGAALEIADVRELRRRQSSEAKLVSNQISDAATALGKKSVWQSLFSLPITIDHPSFPHPVQSDSPDINRK